MKRGRPRKGAASFWTFGDFLELVMDGWNGSGGNAMPKTPDCRRRPWAVFIVAAVLIAAARTADSIHAAISTDAREADNPSAMETNGQLPSSIDSSCRSAQLGFSLVYHDLQSVQPRGQLETQTVSISDSLCGADGTDLLYKGQCRAFDCRMGEAEAFQKSSSFHRISGILFSGRAVGSKLADSSCSDSDS